MSFQRKYLLSNVNDATFRNAMKKSKRPEIILNRINLLKYINSMKVKSNYLQPQYVSKPNLATFIENEPKYLNIIKRLARNLECNFTSIVLSACTASILDFLKNKRIYPNNLHLANTCREFSENINDVLDGKILQNHASFDYYNVQTVEGNFYLQFKTWLKCFKTERDSGDFQLLFLLIKISNYIPLYFVKRSLTSLTSKTLLGVTNIPGLDFGKFGNLPIKKMFFFVNHFAYTKFILFVLSYGGKLQVSLMSDETVDINRKDLQSILENTFKKIDDLCDLH
nr:uncharacterized protein LOC111428067 [Onthophagus taurus]